MKHIECCRECQERSEGCHGRCERYKAEREAVCEEKNIIFQNRREKKRYDDYLAKTKLRMKRNS